VRLCGNIGDEGEVMPNGQQHPRDKEMPLAVKLEAIDTEVNQCLHRS
jgi:hypothetical protein